MTGSACGGYYHNLIVNRKKNFTSKSWRCGILYKANMVCLEFKWGLSKANCFILNSSLVVGRYGHKKPKNDQEIGFLFETFDVTRGLGYSRRPFHLAVGVFGWLDPFFRTMLKLLVIFRYLNCPCPCCCRG